MKLYVVLTLVLSLLLSAALPVLSQTSGQITYEIVRKVDQSGMRIMIDGVQIKPGDPNFPTDVPDTRAFGQKVLFNENYAKENRDEQNAIVRTFVQDAGSGRGVPQTTNMGRPFEEQVFVDLLNQKTITLLTIGKDKDAKTYRAESPVQRSGEWQLSDQTKKIAGYNCRKATVPFRKENYTVWFTTELPIAYSPIHELTPEKGVALLIESSREQVRAVKINTNPVLAKDLLPDTNAETVTFEKLTDLREKAMADFRQQLMMGERN